ncbi:Pentatricopeptide repeat-containing protein [Actinidia chinensis var. chinensis]|uniref:Pentatricopeptide repeat-containing protein n=1 Tax=Actinidia chinensis var. chinensis TaxID=1590841 RepID=A0A2R6Q3W9_ACTCC|nr:Pentatricopeptide repeat-containing protein [Actinidia chinensis var. chinensis]
MHHQLIKRLTSITGSSLSSSSQVKSRVKDLVSKGLYDQALLIYRYKQLHHPTPSILPSLIKASFYAQNQYVALQLHCASLKTAAHFEPIVSNSLITMYAKFSHVQCARKVFDKMPQRDNITWSSMVNCYTQNGNYAESLQMFKDMYVQGFAAKPELIASVLSACVRTGDFGVGREIHALVVVNGWMEESVFLSTALVDLYLRCHDSLMAFQVFERMEVKNEVSWTAMISGCATCKNYGIALDCFRAMQVEGIKPNRVTLVAILPLCIELGCLRHGKEIHSFAFRHGFNYEIRMSSALIHMYGKCGGSLRTIQLIFERSTTKDVVIWSSIIATYSQSEDSAEEAIKIFHQMQIEGFQPNYVTLLAMISACTALRSVSHGRGVHGFILKYGLVSHLLVGNSLLNMYSKCGCLVDSSKIFREMSTRDNFSWSTLIGANGLHGQGKEALQLFLEMQERGVEPDAVTFVAILSACNHAGLVEEGKNLFNKALKDEKIPLSMEHYACHIDLLGRAGEVEEACEVVSRMPMKPGMRIWSSLVSACKAHARLEVAEILAHQLVKIEPENAANYTLLSMVYAESGNWVGVEQVRKFMRTKGLRKSYGYSRIELENEEF